MLHVKHSENKVPGKALRQKSGTKIKGVFQDSVAQQHKTDSQAWTPYILCVYGPNIVVLGARCPQPSSSWSLPPKSFFGRHFSQYHQALSNPSSQYLFSFGSQSSLSTSCLRTPQNSSIGWSYGTARGSFSTQMGLKWAFLPFSFPQSIFCLCSSSGLNSGCLVLVYILTAASLTILSTQDLSAFIFSASFIEVTPFRHWHWLPLGKLAFPVHVLCSEACPI